MNINIYFHHKILRLHLQNQPSQNQQFKNIDEFSNAELQRLFGNFQQNDEPVLEFSAGSEDAAFAKLSAVFHFIEAAGGIVEKDGRHLFIRRFGTWDLPKGKIDKGEVPAQAAVRECEEECGLTELKLGEFIAPVYHIYEYKGGHALKKTWWYHMTTTHAGPLVPQLEEHIDMVEWFDKEQVCDIVLENTYDSIKEILTKAKLI